jgi:serine/threonine protein kinase
MSQCLNPNCLYQNPANAKFCQHCGSELLLFRQYRAIQILGQGGFGRTFLAVDEGKPSQPNCVLIQFYPQAQGTNNIEKANKLFKQEARQLYELGKHTQIPKLLAYFTEGGYQYLVQEYIDGQDLDKILKTQGKFNEEQIRDILQQILPVLQTLHEHNLIHRDIKPQNIIRHGDGTLMLVDFGTAKQVANAAFSITGDTIGSTEYISPEQAIGKAKPNSDIYSLGATCVRLLTQIEQNELYDTIINGAWRNSLDTSVEKKLGEILDSMLVVAVKKRYQSADEVLRDLQSAEAPSSSPPPKPKSPSPSTATSGSQVELRSAVGYDYTRLRDLLTAGNWKEADEETAKAMLKVASKGKKGVLLDKKLNLLIDLLSSQDKFLSNQDIEKFPCEDLQTIDRLWVTLSNGKFGFSVQKEILQQLGGTFDQIEITQLIKFSDIVGWRGKHYEKLKWDGENCLNGHLPVIRWHFGGF